MLQEYHISHIYACTHSGRLCQLMSMAVDRRMPKSAALPARYTVDPEMIFEQPVAVTPKDKKQVRKYEKSGITHQ